MRALETYHHNFTEAGTYTFDLANNKPSQLLVKNLTDDNILISYGNTIDTAHDSYVYMAKNTAEVLDYKVIDTSAGVKVTVQAEGTGIVELRILDY
ncbi:MAG: hypothetical protein IKQ46_10630 [Bacteroidales bacterium]|nr:hypothetical protein [Bacteroidales bacterium]